MDQVGHLSTRGYDKVRDLCIFSPHSVIRDPPFSRIDLASCRNVLVYFDLQTEVVGTALATRRRRPCRSNIEGQLPMFIEDSEGGAQ